MAITTRAQLSAALQSATAATLSFNKYAYPATVSGISSRYSTFSMASAGYPAATGSLTPVQTCTSSTAGAIPIPGTLAPGNTWYLAGISISGPSTNLGLTLLDRYVQVGGLNSNTTGQLTYTAPALPARAGDTTAGTMLFCEYAGNNVNPLTGTARIGYTSAAGVTGRSAILSYTQATSMPAGYTIGPFNLQAGDTGVQTVTSVTNSAANGATPATVAVVVARPIAVLPVTTGVETRLGWADLGLPNLGADPCLYWIINHRSSTDVITQFSATLSLVQG